MNPHLAPTEVIELTRPATAHVSIIKADPRLEAQVVLPGTLTVLAYVGYIGTSMAAPHVSGLAAMLMQQGITDPAAIEAAMELAATDIGNPGRDAFFGFGLIDAIMPAGEIPAKLTAEAEKLLAARCAAVLTPA